MNESATFSIQSIEDLYSYVFGLSTTNDYWKRCIREATIDMLERDDEDAFPSQSLTDGEREEELAILQKYAKHYEDIETGTVSEEEVLKDCAESDALLPDTMPEEFNMYMSAKMTETKFFYYCPVHHRKNPAKLIEVIERSSPDDFGHLVELSYKVWKHYDTLLE